MNNTHTLELLRTLGLTTDEARLYLELLREPSTHMKLAHATGINRTKVYRLADDLEKRSLASKRTDDRGTFLVAADPATLEIVLVNQEEKLKRQRQAYQALAPALKSIQNGSQSFAIQTYEGVEGFKQMLWHELKTDGEALIFGGSNINNLVDDKEWGDRHRIHTVEAGYTIRELLNPKDDEVFTLNPAFMARYTYRVIAPAVITIRDSIAIYNNTVATYHWQDDKKVGWEVIDHHYAQMTRQIFEHYWQLAS